MVDSAVLPDVFRKVLEAKRLLSTGVADTAADAARRAGLSRSAFYKYRDSVFSYDDSGGRIFTLHLILTDQPGVLSAVLTAFAQTKANVLTVNQNIPSDGEATVSISARSDRMTVSVQVFVHELLQIDGVRKASLTGGRD